MTAALSSVKFLQKVHCNFRRTWMRSSRMVRASSRNSGFDPSILWHIGIWRALNETVLINVYKKKKIHKIPLLTLEQIRQQLSLCSAKNILCCWMHRHTNCINNEIRCCSLAIMRKNSIIFYVIFSAAEEGRGWKISRQLPLNEKRLCDHLYICIAFSQLQNLRRQSL